MKKNYFLFGLVILCFSFLTFPVVRAEVNTEAECLAGFSCTDSTLADPCDHECIDFYGTVVLDLNCRPGETYSYTGTLTVNGLENTKEVTCDPNPPTCNTILDPSGWSTTSTTAKVGTCTDAGSGCDPTSYTEEVITTNGATASVTAADFAGNVGTCTVSESAKIDSIVPTCTASLSTTDWTNGDVITSIACDDLGGSGVLSCLIDTPISIANGTFTETETKTGTVTDNAGNVGTCVTSAAKIDKIIPIFARDCVSDGLNYPSSFPTGWTNKDVDCTFSLTDANSRLKEWDVSMISSGTGDEELLSSFSASVQDVAVFNQAQNFTGTQDRTYSFSGFLADNATNQTTLSNVNDFAIKIDKTSPTIPADPNATIQMDNGSGTFRNITTLSTTFEANEEFKIKLDIVDASPGSGMDWNASKIKITGPVNIAETPIDSLLGGFVFTEVDNVITITDLSDVFEKAGDYVIDFILVDKAGNAVIPSVITGLKVEIVASEISDSASTIINGGTSNCGIANNVDSCDFTLTLNDRFNNPILDRGVITTTIDSQDISGSEYDLTTGNTDQIFRKGLRFVGGVDNGIVNQFTFSNSTTNDQAMAMKSLVPTVNIETGAEGASQMTIAEKTISVKISANEVGLDGIILGTLQTPASLGANLKFEPWINAIINGKTGPILLPTMSSILGSPMDLWIYANNGTVNLPTDFSVFVKGHSPTNTSFINEDLSSGDGYETVFTGISGQTSNPFIVTELTSTGGVVGDLDIVFSSKVEQSIAGKTITYSGGIYGDRALLGLTPNPADPSITSYIVGADIEGSVLGASDFVLREDDSGVLLGETQQKDVRENMNRNAANLIAGSVATTIAGMQELDLSSLVDGGISYYKGGTLKLGTSGGGIVGGGKHTILIEDGNLFIAGDLKYSTNTDSLGVILINSKSSDRNNGNIFIGNNVQQFVGTYFAHGGMTSTTATGAVIPNITDVVDRNPSDFYVGNDLEKQLLLNGTIFTRNTLGGALLTTKMNPWGTALNEEDALKYDLHFVRRYVNIDSLGVVIPDATNTNCVKISISCDNNEHAFIIRPDGKAVNKETVPPGFEYFGTINTN
jgi:hypothetical protein